MGFDDLHHQMLQLEPRAPLVEVQVAAVNRAAALPDFMVSVRCTYDTAPSALRPVLKRRIRSLLARLATEMLPAAPPDLALLVDHVTDKVRHYAHHGDPDVRRWAAMCAAIHADPALRTTLAAVAASYAELADLTRASLSYLVSECNRRGAPVLPPPAS